MNQLFSMQVFCQIVDSGSMASAARTLGVAAATVTGVLAASEKKLGVRLLDRSTRRLHITEAGQIWYSYAKRILEESAAAEDAVRSLATEPRGLLRLSLPLGVAMTFVYPHLQEFSCQFPQIELDLQVNDKTVDLLEHGFDMALRVGHLKDSDLVARPLLQYQRALYASPAYLAVHGQPEHPDELAAHLCLLYQHDMQPVHWDFCVDGLSRKFLLKGKLRSNETHALLCWARAGLGITRQPDWLLAADLKAGNLVSILDAYRVTKRSELPGIYAVLPKATSYPVKLEAFISFFKQKIQGSVV
jgi:LysR family transcriptional activator of dmlA